MPAPQPQDPLSLFEAHLGVLARVVQALAPAHAGQARALVTLAALLLLRAATEWRPASGLRFSAYAEATLGSELLRHLDRPLPPLALPPELAPFASRLQGVADAVAREASGRLPAVVGQAGGRPLVGVSVPLALVPEPASPGEEAARGLPWGRMRRHLPAVLGLVLATELGVLAHAWHTPPVWVARATLDSGLGAQRLLGGGGDWFSQGTLIANVMELLKCRTVLTAVIGTLKLADTPETLARRLTVSRLGQAGLLRLEAEASEAPAAAELANTVVREFLRYYASTQSLDARSDQAFFESQTRAAARRLREAEGALTRFRRDRVPELQAALPGRTSDTLAQRDEAARSLAATTAALAVVQRELAAIRRDPLLSERILDQQAVVTAGDRLRDLAANLADAKALYGPASPVVKGLQAQLARARSQLRTSATEATEQNPALAEARARLVQLRADAAMQRARLTSLDATLARLHPQTRQASQDHVRHDQLTRDVKVAEGHYMELQTRLGQSTLAAMGATSVPVSVVDPAVVPPEPEGAKLPLKLVLGALLSLGLGGLASYVAALASARRPGQPPPEAAAEAPADAPARAA
ncbi:MAG: GNVR domain-containing protein [Candidatus Sericytochromatia bacterium]|nr:GNVR domain-containing protein [Candidatus Sericytochromatia bacterium]